MYVETVFYFESNEWSIVAVIAEFRHWTSQVWCRLLWVIKVDRHWTFQVWCRLLRVIKVEGWPVAKFRFLPFFRIMLFRLPIYELMFNQNEAWGHSVTKRQIERQLCQRVTIHRYPIGAPNVCRHVEPGIKCTSVGHCDKGAVANRYTADQLLIPVLNDSSFLVFQLL